MGTTAHVRRTSARGYILGYRDTSRVHGHRTVGGQDFGGIGTRLSPVPAVPTGVGTGHVYRVAGIVIEGVENWSIWLGRWGWPRPRAVARSRRRCRALHGDPGCRSPLRPDVSHRLDRRELLLRHHGAAGAAEADGRRVASAPTATAEFVARSCRTTRGRRIARRRIDHATVEALTKRTQTRRSAPSLLVSRRRAAR